MPVETEERRLQALHELGILDTPGEERYDRIVRLAQRLFDVPIVLITLVDRDRQWFKARVGLDEPETEREASFCARAIEFGPDTFEVEDARLDERFAATRLVESDPHIVFYAGQPLETTGGHRLGTICLIDTKPRRLTEAEKRALRDLATWVTKEMTVDEELDRAAQVQRSLLPRSAPDVPGFQVAARCVPTRVVGGDFFDWYVPRPGALAISVGDVMGKGMPAAIMMATARAVLRAAARQPTFAASVQYAAEALYDDLAESDSFLTLFGAYLDVRSRMVRYVDAGHGLALVRRADGAVRVPGTHGLPMGVDREETYREGRIQMNPGDAALVYSDGLAEALGDADPYAIADHLTGAASAEEMVDRLVRAAGPWTDDITVLAVACTGPPQ